VELCTEDGRGGYLTVRGWDNIHAAIRKELLSHGGSERIVVSFGGYTVPGSATFQQMGIEDGARLDVAVGEGSSQQPERGEKPAGGDRQVRRRKRHPPGQRVAPELLGFWGGGGQEEAPEDATTMKVTVQSSTH